MLLRDRGSGSPKRKFENGVSRRLPSPMRNFALQAHITRLLIFCLLTVLAGCTNLRTRNGVPAELTNKAHIDGIADARFWGDEWPQFSMEMFANFSAPELRAHYSGIYGKPHDYLAISGGGANGAFGAGLLVGWTAAGTRPEFTVVTGVSTGALTAPFAFLGPAYDNQLQALYTKTRTRDILKRHNIIATLLGEAAADTTPLLKLIATYINAELIETIAQEYRSGRRLFIGTFNLDAGRSVIWNIGAIAASNHPQKIALIHEVLLASASIPVAFPPVLIPVLAEGQYYDEMHVDGGSGSQVFVYPAAVDWGHISRRLEVQGQPQVYVIRNSFLEPDYRGIKRHVLPIASRTVDSLIRTQGIGDLYQIYALCRRDGNDFNLAYIPSEFAAEPQEVFDPEHMRQLFDRGYRMAVGGYPWKKAPPGFILPEQD